MLLQPSKGRCKKRCVLCAPFDSSSIHCIVAIKELGDRLDHIMNACKLGHVELLQYFAEDLSYPWKEWKDGVREGTFVWG